MYFDDVVEKYNLYMYPYFLKDAILFRFDADIIDNIEVFWSKKGADVSSKYIGMPYANMFLQFGKDMGVWMIGGPTEQGDFTVILIEMSKKPILEATEYIHHAERIGKLGSAYGTEELKDKYFCEFFKRNKKFQPLFSNLIIFKDNDDFYPSHLGGVHISEKIGKTIDIYETNKKEVVFDWDFINSGKAIFIYRSSLTCKIVIYILQLINCVNIKRNINKHSQKIQKKRERKNKLPLVSYYTLEINQKKQQSRSQGTSVSENRIHLCRGHFKEYTEENPLFGKHTGLWWWQPSVRGNKEKGTIVKDYKVRQERLTN